MEFLPYSPSLPPFIISSSFLIPSPSSVNFCNTFLFSPVQSKTKYLLLFFSSTCPSTLPIIRSLFLVSLNQKL